MKKINVIILTVLMLMAVLASSTTVIARKAKSLYGFAMSKKEVNIYIGKFRGSDKAKEIDAKKLIEAIESRLKKRKTITFNIVKDLKDADLSVRGGILRYIYREKDPIDIFIPLGLIIDLFTDKNYARLEFEVEVLDTKKKKIVWDRYLKATITQFDLSKEKSIPLIIDRAAYVFIKECFGKPKGKIRI